MSPSAPKTAVEMRPSTRSAYVVTMDVKMMRPTPTSVELTKMAALRLRSTQI